MSATIGLRAKIAAELAKYMPEGVQVSAVDPAKIKTAKAGAIWVKSITAHSEFRAIGGAVKSHRWRAESITVVLAVLVYREAPSHRDAAAAALDRIDEIVAGVEQTIEAKPDLSINGAVDWSRLADLTSEIFPADNGWGAAAEIKLACESRPTGAP